MHSMALSTPADGGAPSNSSNLKARDGSAIPAEPPSELIYRHEARVRTSIRNLWASRDIIYTLAERDIRAQYKQATLGLGWALIAPCAMLGIFIIIFSRTKALGVPPGVPYPLFAFIGILSWTFFAQALGTGGTALLMNHDLMSKTQFPRECFPLETLLVCAVNSVLAWIPLAVLTWALGLAADGTFEVYDLLADRAYTWRGSRNYVELRPAEAPAHVFRVAPAKA